MAERICPSCGRGVLTRCGRKGLWEQYVLPVFGVFPWRCGRCRTRFRLSDRGTDFQLLPAKPGHLDKDASTTVPDAEPDTGGDESSAVTDVAK